MQKIIEEKAITLVALVITIIILIILASVTIVLLIGPNSLISRSVEARFKSNFSEVEEKVMLYWANKESEAITNGTNPTVFEKLPIKIKGENESTVNKDEFSETLVVEIEDTSSKELDNVNIYEIDKGLISTNVSHTYLIDIDSLQVYDKEGENFGGKMHHTLNGLGVEAADSSSSQVIAKKGETSPATYKTEDGDGWLKPDMTGFGMNYTKLIYYNKDNLDEEKEVSLQEYIDGGRKSNFEEDGKNYVLDGYDLKMWANAKTVANGLTTCWVWQPRYAYKINGTSSTNSIDVIFIDMNNNPIGDKYSGKYTVNNDGTLTVNAGDGDTFTSGTYIIHPGFTEKWTENGETKTKELQGIWMSKYEPSSTANANHTLESGECYPPDMTGFDPQNTYIELYDASTDSFVEEVKLADANLKTINNDKRWYDYKNKVWANIKTIANGVECWWVWEPRYAYTLVNANQETNVIFVDLKNKPYDKEKYGDYLASGMIVQPGFTVTNLDGSKKELKGIWISKYEPSNVNNADKNATSGECLEPDFTGFDSNNTKVIYWNPDFSKTVEKTLSEYNSSGKPRQISHENETYTFYDYKNKVWANIKTTANGLEAWWVWEPRYAYNISNGGQEVDVVFIDLENKPVDKATYGNTLRDGMRVHPGFTETWTEDGETKTKELSGIWISKYEPSWKDISVSSSDRGTSIVTADNNGNITSSTDGNGVPIGTDFPNTRDDGHTHNALGYGTKKRYVTKSTHWCTAWTGSNGDCNNYGYYRYCSLCGYKLDHYWCDVHFRRNENGRVSIYDEDVP